MLLHKREILLIRYRSSSGNVGSSMTDASAEEGVSTLISGSGCHVSLRHSTVHSDSSGGGLFLRLLKKQTESSRGLVTVKGSGRGPESE